jgi:hypothetical protein
MDIVLYVSLLILLVSVIAVFFFRHKRGGRYHLSKLVKAGSILNVRKGEVAIALYTSAADKMKVFSSFIHEGIKNGGLVEYIYPDEESELVRAELKEHGIDVEKYEKRGTLLMRSLAEYYLPDGNFDKDRAVKKGLHERTKARIKGYEHIRELIDVGDFSFLNGQRKKYLDYWDDPKWGAPPGVGILYEPFIMELTAINVGDMSETQIAEILKAFGGDRVAPTKLIDLIEWKDAFSKSVGLTHEQMLGHKFLVEFDPTSTYEKPIRDFVKEALANVESILIYTPRGSVIHASLAEQPIDFFLMSSVSAPKMITENEMLLPANNPTLILDSFNKVLETHTSTNVCLVFDSLSELLISVGLEKTYKFTKYALEMLAPQWATVLFLFNPNAHDPKTVSSLKSLFRDQLAYRKDGMQAIRIP